MSKYNIGLSITPESIGWSVIDDQFKPKKGYIGHGHTRTLTGVAKFTAGKTAEDTRLIRDNRRRLARRKKRLSWLNDIFAPYLASIDSYFLMRLKYSSLAGDDKKFAGGTIFDDLEQEKAYYKQYPTIYHLRNALMTENKKFDLRLVYLAIHSIVKYRGHFNDKTPMASFNMDAVDYNQALKEIQKAFDDTDIASLVALNVENGSELHDLLLDKAIDKRDQMKQALELLQGSTNKINHKVVAELVKAITGRSFKLDNLLQLDEDNGAKLSFEDEDADAIIDDLAVSLSNEQYAIIKCLQKIYLAIALEQLVPNGKTFSQAQIDVFNSFHDQYKTLVAFRKQTTSMEANQSIHEILDRYASPAYQDKGAIDRETFYHLLQKWLKKFSDVPEAKQIQEWIDQDEFMIKPRNKRNQLIPHQLHQYELDRIIENQKKYYPFLAELNPREERRKDAKYKLDELVAFRLPYYVGPLVDNERVVDAATSRFAWADIKDNDDGEITPWNFADKIDVESTANNFIRNLTAKDSCLMSEDVLPKATILYQRFNVLNELNKVRIDGDLLRPGDKQKIFNDLFRTHKTVSVKRLKDYLKKERGYMHDPQITGLPDPKQFTTSYATYIDMKRILGDLVDNPNYQDDLDLIVEWSTIFPQGPMYRHKLKSLDWVSEQQRNKLANLHYSGWGRYSKETLTGLVNGNGERIIDVMWNTNLNFAQVINKPEFKKQIDAANQIYLTSSESFNEVLDHTFTSPQNKKAIRQTMYVVNDIVKKMGHAPATISIQFLREEQPGKESQTRKKQLLATYKKVTKDMAGNYWADKQELSKELKDQSNLSDKLYLYFQQLGRDLYSGLKIDLDDLKKNPSGYKVVHILPPSFIKDDSLNNKALIHAGTNYSNMAPIRNSRRTLWQLLRAMGLLTNAKMGNLLQEPTAIGRGAREGLAKRQLTANSQIIKLAATFLSERFKEDVTCIIEVRNSLVDQLKNKLQINPMISINDYEHGMDAYLTATAGLYLFKTYPKLAYFFVYGAFPYAMEDLAKVRSFNFLYHLLRKEDDFIVPDSGQTSVTTISKYMQRMQRLPLQIVTNQPIENHGMVFKQTIFPHQIYTDKFLPIKQGRDPKLYGGYRSIQGAFLSVVRVNLPSGQHYYRVVTIPRTISDRINHLIESDKQKAQEEIVQLVANNRKGKEKKATYTVEILKVYYHQTLEINGHVVTLGSERYLWNADQLLLSQDSIKTLGLQYSSTLDEVEDLDDRLIAVYDEIVEKVDKYMPIYQSNKAVEKFTAGRKYFEELPVSARLVEDEDEKKIAKANNKFTVLNNMVYALRTGASRSVFNKTLHCKGEIGSVSFNSILHAGDKVIITSPAGLNNHEYTLI